MSGGTESVTLAVVCVGDTITFTATGVTDGGNPKERVMCSTIQPIPLGGVTYDWTLTVPPGYPAPLPPLTGAGATVNVAALIPGSYSVFFEANATRTQCPPPGITVGSATGMGVSVRADSIDATSPNGTAANYTVEPVGASVDAVMFDGPTAMGSLTSATGSFAFVFNQSDVPVGQSTIRLDYSVGGNACVPADITVMRTSAKAPPTGTEFDIEQFVLLLDIGPSSLVVGHQISGTFHLICYSGYVVPGSKTLWVGNISASIQTADSIEFPTEIVAWTESNRFRDASGDHFETILVPATGATIPQQSLHFRSASGTFDVFLVSRNGAASVARIDALQIQTLLGPVFAMPGLLSDQEIDLVFEGNSEPMVACP